MRSKLAPKYAAHAAQDIAAACADIAECDLFTFFPLGKSLDNSPHYDTSAFLKTARNSATRRHAPAALAATPSGLCHGLQQAASAVLPARERAEV